MSGCQKGRNTAKAGVGPGVLVVQKLLPLQTGRGRGEHGGGVGSGRRGMGPQA